MNKNIEIKISLMEDIDSSENEGKKDFIIRSSARYNPIEYFENYYRDLTADEKLNEELFENFLSSSMDLIFGELLEKTSDKVDSVGIWIQKDSETLENSIGLEYLDSMNQYGDESVVPIYELYKMTLQKYNES